MKKLFLAAVIAALSPISAFAQPAGLPQPAPAAAPAKPGDAFKTDEQKTLYALGLALAQQMKQAVASFSLTAADNKLVLMGIRDAFTGGNPKVDMQVYGPKIGELGQARAKVRADKEKEKSKPFLAKMAKAPGAQTSASGLIYFEIAAGKGAAPAATDKVKAHYKGTLIDGTEFDASSRHGAGPMEFSLSSVIPCWTEGIQKIKVGGKAKLICPSDIAYGDRGQGGIPAGATLIFEVELTEVVQNANPKEAADFLAKAAKEPGAQVFPSGLVYKETKAGTGANPKPEDTVKAHYHGTLTDGTVFDSSVQRGEPAEFPLQHVIKCWQEGLPKMKVGGKARLVCPAAIAYGEQGRPGIPGGATLIFDVELFDIVKR